VVGVEPTGSSPKRRDPPQAPSFSRHTFEMMVRQAKFFDAWSSAVLKIGARKHVGGLHSFSDRLDQSSRSSVPLSSEMECSPLDRGNSGRHYPKTLFLCRIR
jgi:hypothetical protein